MLNEISQNYDVYEKTLPSFFIFVKLSIYYEESKKNCSFAEVAQINQHLNVLNYHLVNLFYSYFEMYFYTVNI